MTRHNPYEMGLDKNEANFGALSPLSFIERSASVYGMRRSTSSSWNWKRRPKARKWCTTTRRPT